MKVIILNSSILISGSERELSGVKDHFTLQDERGAFSRGGFDSKKIKNIKFHSVYKNALALNVGFLYDLVIYLKNNKIKADIEDRREKLFYQNKEFSYEELRSYFNPDFKYVDHQINALKRMLTVNRGIIKAPTSSGKSNIILAFCKLVNLKVLILVNKKDLGRQIHDLLNENGFPVLYRDGSKKGAVNKGASYVSTIGVAKELHNNFDVVIVDECHRASSDTFQLFLSKSSAKAFYGFSATPEGNHKVDFMKVKKFLGNIIDEIDIQELIENEVITYPVITFIEMLMPQIPRNTEWASVNEICIINNTERNEKIKELAEKHDMATLILVRNIEHGKELERIIDNSIFVFGEDDTDIRKEAIDKLTSGEIKVLIASNIFNEGISINAIRVLINGAGGKSRVEVIQRLGRALRKDEGKEEAIVYDFFDVGQHITQRHSKERMNIYSKVGFPVKVLES
jgi:superfamily II DNA or RNA helicase